MSPATQVLQIAEFRALLGARITSALAGSALATVIAYQVYELTRDPLSLGWLGLVEAIPALVFALFGGHIADRRDRRNIILASEAVMVVCALGLLIVSTDAARLGLASILAIIFVSGIAGGFARPAMTAFETQVIPIEFAAVGASWTSNAWLVGGLLGPAIGGIVYALAGPVGAYALIAALLAAAFVFIALIARKPIPTPEAHESVWTSLSQGVRYVFTNQYLVGSMALDLFAVLFGGAMAMLPIFASDILHVGPIGLGVLRTSPTLGALLVTLVATRRPPTKRAGRNLLWCVAGFGVSMIVFGLSQNFWLSLAALFFSGLTDGVSMIIRTVIVRVMSPEQLRGRIASVSWVFIGASNEIGAFESGVAASLLGVVPSVALGGVVTLLVVGATAALAPKLRTLNLDQHDIEERQLETAAA